MMSDPKDLLRMLNLCESEVEKLFFLAAYEHIEGLVPQYAVFRYRIDFAIPDKMIAIEIDGHEYHKTKAQRTHDAQRDREIKLTLPDNWTIIRFTGTEIFQNTTRCVQEILQFIQKRAPYQIISIDEFQIQCGTNNRNIDDWHTNGHALIKLGKYGDAIKCFNEAIRLDPNDAQAWIAKGVLLKNQSKYDDAIKCYEEVIRQYPNCYTAWDQKGKTLDKQGKYEGAVIAYDEAIRLHPNCASFWYNKGIALWQQGSYASAIKCFNEAIRLDPKYAMAWYNKGIALYNLGKYDEAIRSLDAAICLDPKFAAAWSFKGATLNAKREYKDAIRACDKAIELDPTDADSWYNKGIAISKQNKYKCVALKLLGRATEADAAFAKARRLGYKD